MSRVFKKILYISAILLFALLEMFTNSDDSVVDLSFGSNSNAGSVQ